jgi:hypothetical protein
VSCRDVSSRPPLADIKVTGANVDAVGGESRSGRLSMGTPAVLVRDVAHHATGRPIEERSVETGVHYSPVHRLTRFHDVAVSTERCGEHALMPAVGHCGVRESALAAVSPA